MGLPKPDLVVFLQLRLAEAATRGEFGRERYEDGKFQERALRRFHQLMADQTVNWKVRGLPGSPPGRLLQQILFLCELCPNRAVWWPVGELGRLASWPARSSPPTPSSPGPAVLVVGPVTPSSLGLWAPRGSGPPPPP